MSDKFVPCIWSCEKCKEKGEVLPWVRHGEKVDDAVWRHVVETKGRCAIGCQYVAAVKEPGRRGGMTNERWKLDTEYQENIVEEVCREGDHYTVKSDGGWLLWDCDFEPMVGDTARYFGRGFGYPVRGIVCFPKRGGMPLVVRYQSLAEHEAEREVKRQEYERERAARVQQPRVEFAGRVYDEEMGEISGFSGGYEEACRKMVLAGMKWLDEHPNADPQFHGFKGIYGVITEDNADAEALTKAIIDASDGEATGAMHQSSVGHVMAYKRLGWDGYRAEMLKREEESVK